MKETKNITLYQCDHCKKKYFRSHACEKHEKFCAANPDNQKACSGCVFLQEVKIDYYVDDPYGDGGRQSNGFRCSQKDLLIYPLKAERLDLPNRFPETFEDQYPMPNECELADYSINFI